MWRAGSCLLVILPMLAPGCGAPPENAAPTRPVADAVAPEPEYLPHPFSAEQIRDAWSPGLALVMRQTTPDGEALERWTVVTADEQGADIEFAGIDAGGAVEGEPRVVRSGWDELRNHATFPVAAATREESTRDTRLGLLDGWVYTVNDPDTGTVTEFFFAKALPGPPVETRVSVEGATVMFFEQLERRGP